MKEGFYLAGQYLSWLELCAMLSGMAGVWLTIRQSVWCFPAGILNVTLYAWLFFDPGVRLYADALLQCIYVVLLIYGWLSWVKKNDRPSGFQPQTTSTQLRRNLLLLGFGGTLATGYFLSNYTNASLPWIDALLTCMSLIAQWMVARKKIENWLVWILADAIYIPMYLYKHLPLTAILYFTFLIMAIRGYSRWKKDLAVR
ncbi:MAG: nicotinamide mononucleotide transporter [Bacteroidia bacterium]|nr:nicotinamide mononucleotide transporter [Bacteroidia bacterium]